MREDHLPEIADPWAIPIDAKGIVRRKKLKSNIEMVSVLRDRLPQSQAQLRVSLLFCSPNRARLGR